MPYRMWGHSLCCGTFQTNSPECNDGQRRGVYAGWHFSMYESMARYQYIYGLKPLGPHRGLTDQLLSPLRVDCPRCGHAGLLDLNEGERCRACPVCEGTGGSWGAPDDVVKAIRESILEAFPDAAAPPVCFLGGPLALKVPENVMIDFSDHAGSRDPGPPARTGAGLTATYVPPEEPVPIDHPATRPRSATFLAKCAWSWGPANSRVDAYYLSSNRRRTHWILWVEWPGSEGEWGEKLPPLVGAYCGRAGIDREAAAALLIRTVWEAEQESLGEPPSAICEEGLLSEPTLRQLGREIWRADESASTDDEEE
jgi:hypothetical protein